jgi:hypothetical protein
VPLGSACFRFPIGLRNTRSCRNILNREATVQAERPVEREIILDVGAEGGSLTLYGRRELKGLDLLSKDS